MRRVPRIGGGGTAVTSPMQARRVGADLGASVFASLGVGNFRRYFIGQAISFVGTWAQMVAQAWLVLELTGSATWVGITWAVQTLPVLLVGPYGGLVADRSDKRRLIIVLQVLMALFAAVLAGLTISGAVQLWQVLILSGLLGTADAFEKPSRQAFVIEMVGPALVRNAVSLNSVMVNVARVIGPAVAGVIIAAGGIGACFVINAASFIPIVLLLLAMDTAALHPSPAQARGRGQVLAGLRYVRSRRELAVPLLMMAIMGCFAYEFPVTLPYLAKEGFGGDARTFGFMTAAMAVGAVVGGLYNAARGSTGTGTLMRLSVAFGLLVLAAALAPSAGVALVVLVAVGAASVMLMARGNATLQLASDPGMRGRVMALWLVAFLGTTPVGGPVAGWVSSTFGPRWGLILGAAACFVAAGIGAAALARDRREGR